MKSDALAYNLKKVYLIKARELDLSCLKIKNVLNFLKMQINNK